VAVAGGGVVALTPSIGASSAPQSGLLAASEGGTRAGWCVKAVVALAWNTAAIAPAARVG